MNYSNSTFANDTVETLYRAGLVQFALQETINVQSLKCHIN